MRWMVRLGVVGLVLGAVWFACAPSAHSLSFRSELPQSQQVDLLVGRGACPPPLLGAFQRDSNWVAYAPNTKVVFSPGGGPPPGCAALSRRRLLLAVALLLAAAGLVLGHRRFRRQPPPPPVDMATASA